METKKYEKKHPKKMWPSWCSFLDKWWSNIIGVKVLKN
jgi:hypothetical protein